MGNTREYSQGVITQYRHNKRQDAVNTIEDIKICSGES